MGPVLRWVYMNQRWNAVVKGRFSSIVHCVRLALKPSAASKTRSARQPPPPTPSTYPRPHVISVQSHTMPAQASTITQPPPYLVFDIDRRSRPTRQMMREVALLAVALCATSSLAFLTPPPRPVRSRCGVRDRVLQMSGVERNPNFGKLMGGYVQVPWSDGRALSWHPSMSASRSIG